MALEPGIVLAVGPNGAGKTNLLEALHVATQGFSPRTRSDVELIRFGAEGELTVSAQTQDVGEARETLPAPFAADPLEIGFNPDFLREGLESVAPADVLLKLISPLRPGLVQAADDSGFLYLLMPIRLNVP